MIEPGHPCVTMTGSAFVVLRADVDEVDVEPVDLGDELRQGVQLRLALAPVVVRRPVARELLHRRELHALRRDRRRSPCSGQRVAAMRRRRSASASSGNVDAERADRVARGGRDARTCREGGWQHPRRLCPSRRWSRAGAGRDRLPSAVAAVRISRSPSVEGSSRTRCGRVVSSAGPENLGRDGRPLCEPAIPRYRQGQAASAGVSSWPLSSLLPRHPALRRCPGASGTARSWPPAAQPRAAHRHAGRGRRAYKAKIAGLERKVGQPTMELGRQKRSHGAAGARAG